MSLARILRPALAALVLSAMPLGAANAQTAPQQVADHFSSVKTMTGQFVQIGPRGEQTGGKFYLERPGKIRFDYDKPSPVQVKADGKSVVIHNSKLDTYDMYPLSQTPLNLLLADRIDLGGGRIKDVKQDADLLTIKMGDKSVFGDSTITMMFDPDTYDLRQWTITDKQGKDTSVILLDVQEGVRFEKRMFNVPYRQIRAKRRERSNDN